MTDPPEAAFRELSEGAMRGDDRERACALFDAATSRLRACARRRLRELRSGGHLKPADMEDIVQEALSLVWSNRRSYRGTFPGEFCSYIAQIAYRQALRVLRKHRWRGVLYSIGGASPVRVVEDCPYEGEAAVSGTIESL